MPVSAGSGAAAIRGLGRPFRLSGGVLGDRISGNHDLGPMKDDSIREMVKAIKSRNVNNGGGRKVVGGPWMGETKAYYCFGSSPPLLTPAHGLTATQYISYYLTEVQNK